MSTIDKVSVDEQYDQTVKYKEELLEDKHLCSHELSSRLFYYL